MTDGRLIAGLGARTIFDRDKAAALAARHGRPDVLAYPAFRPELAEIARRLGVPGMAVSRAELSETAPRCLTRSARVEALVGLSSVAEACALAAGGASARLLGPRIAADGVTCAWARAS